MISVFFLEDLFNQGCLSLLIGYCKKEEQVDQSDDHSADNAARPILQPGRHLADPLPDELIEIVVLHI